MPIKTKECFKCGIKKELGMFYKHPQMQDGRVNKCKECNKTDVRKNYATKKVAYSLYDKGRIRNNINYIFLHKYSGMKARMGRKIGDRGKTRGDICTRNQFMSWCYQSKNMNKFLELHRAWAAAGYPRKLSPSIDRVNNNLGYLVNNIQWLTQSQNSSKYNK